MRQTFIGLGLIGACLLTASSARSQTAALLVVGDEAQLSELQIAKVMAEESSLWLSVRLEGRTRLALVVAQAEVEAAPRADAWLRALDEATRVRVAPPPGPLAGCGSLERFDLADSGMPALRPLAAVEVSSASSEVELRRRLADAGLPVVGERVARFTSNAPPPFRIAFYEATENGGRTEAVRLIDRGHAEQLPSVVVSGAKSIPLSLIALAKQGVLPLAGESADPSEFPVTYRALDASCDYRAARASWFAQNRGRWLSEVQASSPLFAATVFAGRSQLAPAISSYFLSSSSARAEACLTQVRAARARGSLSADDFACDGADDLARSLSELGFEEPRLSRFFGESKGDGGPFQVAPTTTPRSPLLLATDFDISGCPPQVLLPPMPVCDQPGCAPPPVSRPPVVVNPPDAPYHDPPPPPTPVYRTDDSCAVSVHDASSRDSCGGDTSSSDASSDSCSGDASSSDTASDSCSGDSSSDDGGPDSCTGDASDSSADSCGGGSDSSSDSGGCGKSEYDGDTCAGDSSASNSAQTKSAELRARGDLGSRRPRQVRLSLLTLLAAALALPLRRIRAWR